MDGEYKSSELVDYEEKMTDEIKTNKMLRWYVFNYEAVYKWQSSEDLGKYNQYNNNRSDVFMWMSNVIITLIFKAVCIVCLYLK